MGVRSRDGRDRLDNQSLDLATAKDTVERISRLFEKRYPKLVEVLSEGETDVLAYYGFPVEHRR